MKTTCKNTDNPKNEDDPKIEDYSKNEDDPKNVNDPKNDDDPKNEDEPKNVDEDENHFVHEFTLQKVITYSRGICRSSLFSMFHFGVKIKMTKRG